MRKFLFIKKLDAGGYEYFGMERKSRPHFYFGVRSGLSMLLLLVIHQLGPLIKNYAPSVFYLVLWMVLIAITLCPMYLDHQDYQEF